MTTPARQAIQLVPVVFNTLPANPVTNYGLKLTMFLYNRPLIDQPCILGAHTGSAMTDRTRLL